MPKSSDEWITEHLDEAATAKLRYGWRNRALGHRNLTDIMAEAHQTPWHVTSISADREAWRAVTAYAREHGMRVSKLVRMAVYEYLSNRGVPDEEIIALTDDQAGQSKGHLPGKTEK